MISRSMTPQSLGPWRRGINTVKKETRLRKDEVRDAVNVDLDDDGLPRRRAGFQQVYAGTGIHSLWGGSSKPLFVEDGSLKALQSDYTAVTLTSLQDPSGRMSYAELNGDVYFMNDQDAGKLVGPNMQLRPLGIPTPAAPIVSVGGTGGFSAGKYLLSATFVAPDGEESGASEYTQLSATDGQNFSITYVPQPPAGYTADTWLYLTEVNGKTLYLVAKVPQGTTTYDLVAPPAEPGLELETLHMEPLPAGHIVRRYNGRLYVAVNDKLVFSEPLRFGLYMPHHEYFSFPEKITVMEPVEDGIYVVADKTYFLRMDDPFDEGLDQQVVLPFGGVLHSGMPARGEWFQLRKPLPNEAAFWYSDRGAVIGGPGGRIIPVMEEPVGGGTYVEGSPYFREIDGIRQVGSLLNTPGPDSGLRATDSVVAEVRRNGVIIN